MDDNTNNITHLLKDAAGGKKAALDRVLPVVMDELRVLARRHMARERANHTLQPTALVNEAYLRLVGEKTVHFDDRKHFFAIAAKKMREILINEAEKKRAKKRGGDAQRVPLETNVNDPVGQLNLVDVVALDSALRRLESREGDGARRLAEMVELKLFGGLSSADIAAVLDVSTRTVERDLKTAVMILLSDLSEDSKGG